MGRSDRVWRQLGRTDPYSAIINHDSQAGFFESGERHVEEVLQLVDRLSPAFRPSSVLDFGCGVGRLVIPFAGRFDEVVGVDVSEAMLEEARRNAGAQGCSNVDFATDLALLGHRRTFDLVHSYIVLQHIPERRGLAILAQLVDLIGPGGVGAIHVQYARDASRLRACGHWLRLRMPFGRTIGNLAQGLPARSPLVEMHTYDAGDVLRLLQTKGCREALLSFTSDTGGFLGLMIVFARPSEAS
ncbi:MAG: class I SAM-dependent methyltransferase [Gaiellaceae bacterium]